MDVREVRADGRTVAVRQWGPPDGMPFLFWHALGPGHSGSSVRVAAGPLAAAGFWVLGIDAPGFGRSPRLADENYALERLAALVWAVADALGRERAVVAGHSWGGSVAVFSAAAQPGRTAALVIEAQRDVTGADSWDRLVELLRAEGLDQPWTLDAWRDATRVEADGSVTVRASPEARGAALYAAMRARPSERWHVLGAARMPTLLVLATEPADARDTNERLLPRFLDTVPQAKVVRPGCRHQVFADLGGRAGELTAAWLRDQNLP